MASPSPRAHRAALAQRLERVTEAVRRNARHRADLRQRAAALAVIRAALAGAGIAAAGNPGLRYFAGADAALAALGDSPEQQAADAAFVAGDRKLARYRGLAALAAEMAPDFARRSPPAPGTGSPLAWYAWALAARND